MTEIPDPAALAAMGVLASFSVVAVIAAALLAFDNRNRHP